MDSKRTMNKEQKKDKEETFSGDLGEEMMKTYLETLAAELNFRLLCKEKENTQQGAHQPTALPENTLWVEEITLTAYESSNRQKQLNASVRLET